MESNYIIFIIFCILVILLSLSSVKETFGVPEIISNPGIWFGRQIGGLWKGIAPPAKFARNIAYNYPLPVPNYTWVDRYMAKRNEWVRANKGLPPLKPSPTENVVKLNMKMDNDTENKSFSVPIFGNNVTQGYRQSLIGSVL